MLADLARVLEAGRDSISRAIWNGALRAGNDGLLVVEDNHCFPPDSANQECPQESRSHTAWPRKGQTSYHNAWVGGKVNRDAAW